MLRNYFVPGDHNNDSPKFFNLVPLAVVAFVSMSLFVLSILGQNIVSNNSFLATIREAILVQLANESRMEEQLATLSVNPVLEEAARLKAQDMVRNGYFDHVNPYDTSKTPWHWLSLAGYPTNSWRGENLAADFYHTHSVHNAWMRSPGHRRNIMNGKYREVGIATATGYIDGVKTTVVVQMFGGVVDPLTGESTVYRVPDWKLAQLRQQNPNFLYTAQEIFDETVGASFSPDVLASIDNTNISDVNVAGAAEGEEQGGSASVEEINIDLSQVDISEFVKEVASLTDEETAAQVETALTASRRSSVRGDEALPMEMPKANFFQRLIINPTYNLFWVQLGLIILTGLALIILIVVRIKKQNPKAILAGSALLVVLVLMLILNQILFLTPRVLVA